MNKEIIACEKIEQLYIKCFENKYDRDKCKIIFDLIILCINNNNI